MTVQDIKIEDFSYELPNNKIALTPLAERDAAKLLIFADGVLNESQYRQIHQFIPKGSFMVFNNTRVVNARIIFEKSTGAKIEIFLLEPYNCSLATAMAITDTIEIKCLIGGASKWSKGLVLEKEIIVQGKKIMVFAHFIRKEDEAFVVKLNWSGAISFSELLHELGKIPLPPYIKRDVSDEDEIRYQTVYAQHEGSVAAPTAGLHFTEAVMEKIAAHNVSLHYITLHVGAGTFKPVSSATMANHYMHQEAIEVTASFIQNLLNHKGNVVAVGTTTVRTLESLYWLGVKILHHNSNVIPTLEQWDAYSLPQDISVSHALEALLNMLAIHKVNSLQTSTQLLIAPTYQYRIVHWIVTNFHQPQSTLLLLVAAAIGDQWRDVYSFALKNDYRFLSYGDGCLLKVSNATSRQFNRKYTSFA